MSDRAFRLTWRRAATGKTFGPEYMGQEELAAALAKMLTDGKALQWFYVEDMSATAKGTEAWARVEEARIRKQPKPKKAKGNHPKL